MEKVNVFTGSTGSIGRYIGKAFVPLKTRLEDSVEKMKSELELSQKPIGAFIHLAALVQVGECDRNPQKARELNVEGSRKWFRAAAEMGASHFVFVSTSHVYGRPEGRHPLEISSPTMPLNEYGKSKLEAEQALRSMAPDYPQTKLTIARVFSVLADPDREGFLVHGLHKRARNRDFSAIPGLSYFRDFIPAAEVARDLERLAVWMDAPPIVNISTGRATAISDIARDVFSQYGIDSSSIEAAVGRPGDIEWIVGQPHPYLARR